MECFYKFSSKFHSWIQGEKLIAKKSNTLQTIKSPFLLTMFPPENRKELIYKTKDGNNYPERYLLYGIDYIKKNNIPIKTNLEYVTKVNICSLAAEMIYDKIANNILGAQGKLHWVTPVWKELKKTKCLYVFSEKTIYPILFFRHCGFLPYIETLLISIGVAEKLELLSFRNKIKCQTRLINELSKISKILTFSYTEAEILKNKYDLNNVKFVPFGVDTKYFIPEFANSSIDVLSIGADKNRDFKALIDVAKNLPHVSFKIITTNYHSKKINEYGLPKNVKVEINLPMENVITEMNKSKIIYLPVYDNIYSGATTCMLQAMAKGKAVITDNVGATKKGYGLINGENIIIVNNDKKKISETSHAIKKLLQDDILREDIGIKARETTVRNLPLDMTHKIIYQNIRELFNKAYNS